MTYYVIDNCCNFVTILCMRSSKRSGIWNFCIVCSYAYFTNLRSHTHIYIYICMHIYICAGLLRRCMPNSLYVSEFHIHSVICMIVRHKENV